tara:strand:+ start:14532 stop:15137 length:606 start_codon:yes stop_codon:yes gene_type:complete
MVVKDGAGQELVAGRDALRLHGWLFNPCWRVADAFPRAFNHNVKAGVMGGPDMEIAIAVDGNANLAASSDHCLCSDVPPRVAACPVVGQGVNLEVRFIKRIFLELTGRGVGRMVWPINGKNPLWGRQNPRFQTASRHVSYGYFCARIPGAASRLGREGGEYKTRKGNKPACLWTGSEPPATSAVVRSRFGGVVKRYPEGLL